MRLREQVFTPDFDPGKLPSAKVCEEFCRRADEWLTARGQKPMSLREQIIREAGAGRRRKKGNAGRA